MGKTSSESKNKYNAKAYDRLNIVIPKGAKEQIRACAAKHGESVNALLNRLLTEALTRDGFSYNWPPHQEKDGPADV